MTWVVVPTAAAVAKPCRPLVLIGEERSRGVPAEGLRRVPEAELGQARSSGVGAAVGAGRGGRRGRRRRRPEAMVAPPCPHGGR